MKILISIIYMAFVIPFGMGFAQLLISGKHAEIVFCIAITLLAFSIGLLLGVISKGYLI